MDYKNFAQKFLAYSSNFTKQFLTVAKMVLENFSIMSQMVLGKYSSKNHRYSSDSSYKRCQQKSSILPKMVLEKYSLKSPICKAAILARKVLGKFAKQNLRLYFEWSLEKYFEKFFIIPHTVLKSSKNSLLNFLHY